MEQEKSYKIHLPISLIIKRKRIQLNLNIYRNLHYHPNAAAKREFARIIGPDILNIFHKMSRIKIEYTLFPVDRRRRDVANVCCVVDKFFCDALIRYGIIEDDNYLYVPQVTYKFGEICKDYPRITAVVTGFI